MKTVIMSLITKIANRRDEYIYRRLGGEKLNWIENKHEDSYHLMFWIDALPNPNFLPDIAKQAIEEINALVKERK